MSAPGTRLFWCAAAGAMALHAGVLLSQPGLQGGADLRPHLRLIQLMREAPALRTVYAPAYHVAGALLAPVVGLEAFPRWFALLSAAALIAGFRSFQRAAGLPDAAAALFAFTPYAFALSWCVPKVEAAGYGAALAGLALLLRRRYLGAAAALTATFLLHTAAALFFGLAGGVLALARGDRRALLALAAGSAGAAPLFAAHLAAGCSPAEALLFSRGDYLRGAPRARALGELGRIALLAGPPGVLCALLGARSLWRRYRPVAVLCAVLVALYLNELWLAPFGARSTLDLMRGLTVLAIPTAAAGGVFAAGGVRRAAAWTAVCAAFAAAAALWAVPGSCHVRPVALSEISAITVQRCAFRWREPGRRASAPQAGEVPKVPAQVRVQGAR